MGFVVIFLPLTVSYRRVETARHPSQGPPRTNTTARGRRLADYNARVRLWVLMPLGEPSCRPQTVTAGQLVTNPRAQPVGGGGPHSLVMKLMNSDTHSWTVSLASLAILALGGSAFFMMREMLAMGRKRSCSRTLPPRSPPSRSSSPAAVLMAPPAPTWAPAPPGSHGRAPASLWGRAAMAWRWRGRGRGVRVGLEGLGRSVVAPGPRGRFFFFCLSFLSLSLSLSLSSSLSLSLSVFLFSCLWGPSSPSPGGPGLLIRRSPLSVASDSSSASSAFLSLSPSPAAPGSISGLLACPLLPSLPRLPPAVFSLFCFCFLSAFCGRPCCSYWPRSPTVLPSCASALVLLLRSRCCLS